MQVPLLFSGLCSIGAKSRSGSGRVRSRPEEEITDVGAYNRKHGLMWILYGLGLIVCYVCGMPFGGLVAAYLCMAEVFGGLLGMAAYHNRLNRMYDSKRGHK